MTDDLNVIVATDCGSTTTKAILIEKKGDEYRQTFRGEAPTTVEAPFEDVTRGVLNAFAELEELSGRKILDGEKIITPAKENTGVDIYISTSSAGGGLQMMVAGAVMTMSAQSAQKAALLRLELGLGPLCKLQKTRFTTSALMPSPPSMLKRYALPRARWLEAFSSNKIL